MTESGADRVGSGEIHGAPRLSRRLRVIVVALAVLYLGLGIRSHNAFQITECFFWIVWFVVGGLRPPTTVTVERITRPWRPRRSTIRWDEVEAVTTDPWASRVTILLLVNGDRVALSGVAASQAAAVASIGHKPLRKPEREMSSPAPPSKVVTRLDPERELQRRANALAAQHALMTAELAKIQQRRSPPPAR